jgi:hypothetical protein
MRLLRRRAAARNRAGQLRSGKPKNRRRCCSILVDRTEQWKAALGGWSWSLPQSGGDCWMTIGFLAFAPSMICAVCSAIPMRV